MASLWKVGACLGVAWLITLLYAELIAYWIPLFTCSWPTLHSTDESAQSKNGTATKFVKVAVIADPQLTDRTTHGMKLGSFSLRATQFYSDIYMRRAFRTSILPFEPDEIVFLGDYFDGGIVISDEEFEDSLKRFRHIFKQPERGTKSKSSVIPVHYLAGNHDLGYAGFQHWRPKVFDRYRAIFGEIEHVHRIGQLDFVFVDSQALDGLVADVRTQQAWAFIQNAKNRNPPLGRVLLSHIPLYRPNDVPCGEQRSSPVINQRITWSKAGFGQIDYQNYLSEAVTTRLLDLLKPVLVLSGHDHDQCTIKHRTSSVSVIEHTVGTISWQNGNFYPSFMLLSVASSSTGSSEVVSSELCFLPYRTHGYVWYAVLYVLSVLILLTWPNQSINLGKFYGPIIQFAMKMIRNRPDGGMKLKEEDVDYEYEMIWDAEGAMHLMRKGPTQPERSKLRNSQDSGRGTSLFQPVAKRPVTTEASQAPNVAASNGSGGSIKERASRTLRPFKGKTSLIVRRLKLAVGPFMALVVINCSLCTMLMMKDWTEI